MMQKIAMTEEFAEQIRNNKKIRAEMNCKEI